MLTGMDGVMEGISVLKVISLTLSGVIGQFMPNGLTESQRSRLVNQTGTNPSFATTLIPELRIHKILKKKKIATR